jgi:hypothetical protein
VCRGSNVSKQLASTFFTWFLPLATPLVSIYLEPEKTFVSEVEKEKQKQREAELEKISFTFDDIERIVAPKYFFLKEFFNDSRYFFGLLSRDEELSLLNNKADGTFLVRFSSSASLYVLTVKWSPAAVMKRFSYDKPSNTWAVNSELTFKSMHELVKYYNENALSSDNDKVKATTPLSRGDFSFYA